MWKACHPTVGWWSRVELNPLGPLLVRRQWSLMLEVFKTWLDSLSHLRVRAPDVVWSCGWKEPSHFWCQTELVLVWTESIRIGYILVLDNQGVYTGKGHVERDPPHPASLMLAISVDASPLMKPIIASSWLPFFPAHFLHYFLSLYLFLFHGLTISSFTPVFSTVHQHHASFYFRWQQPLFPPLLSMATNFPLLHLFP